jgi:ATP-dependent DNA helicase RecG
MIINNPNITFDELAKALNKSRRTISRIIKQLREQGIISREGSDKKGQWKVNTDNL